MQTELNLNESIANIKVELQKSKLKILKINYWLAKINLQDLIIMNYQISYQR